MLNIKNRILTNLVASIYMVIFLWIKIILVMQAYWLSHSCVRLMFGVVSNMKIGFCNLTVQTWHSLQLVWDYSLTSYSLCTSTKQSTTHDALSCVNVYLCRHSTSKCLRFNFVVSYEFIDIMYFVWVTL